MQIGAKNNTSFGFNAVKFLDNTSEQVFNKKNKFINKELLQKTLEDVKSLKPTIGGDVDVFICQVGNKHKKPITYLTYQEKGSFIRKGGVCIEGKSHKLENIKEAFNRLVNQVDEIRLMEKSYYEEKIKNQLLKEPVTKPVFMREV